MGKSDPYMNTSGHPVTLDDGSVVGTGEITEAELKGPIAKSEIEAGHLTKVATADDTRNSDVEYLDRHEPENYGSWKADDLRSEADQRGLSTEGHKQDLIDRLKADDEGTA